MLEPLVSVIIPCYNAEKYIEKSVRSILNQTYYNIEVLIADDASEDSSVDIIEMLKKEDSRIRLIKHQTNKKIVYTLNELIDIATGEYIARMDADDISLPERIEKQIRFMESHKNYAACGTNILEIDINDNVIGEKNYAAYEQETSFAVRFFNPVCHPSVLFKADICKRNHYDEKYVYAEDYELWCRLILEKGYKIGNIQEYLFMYRKSLTQTCFIKLDEQKGIVKDIYKKYSVMPPKYIKCHEEVFLKEDKLNSDREMKEYINYCFLLSKNEREDVAAGVVGALMTCCLKRRFFLIFCELLISGAGRKALWKKFGE